MDLRGTIARSSQAFKYIFDPSVDIETPSHARELAEMKRRLDETQKKLDESERKAREKDALIGQLHLMAQLQEQLSAQEPEAKPAPQGQESQGPTPPPNCQDEQAQSQALSALARELATVFNL
ncbi:MAG: hypothetical protein JSW27_04115 [Phycisphaerales bacterium]|nr:MAG: hypothetical protein JSW27_04115 [Phycisphaerales bacterium]